MRCFSMFTPLSFLFVTSIAGAQTSRPIVIGQEHTIESKTLDETRSLMIATPAGYDKTGAPYPVIYVLDGETQFLTVYGLVQELSRAGEIPPMIVIGIPNTDRTRDMTPTNMDTEPASGGGDRFLQFLEREVIPYVDHTYHTASYRLLTGKSYGGLITLHALHTKPELFDAFLAVSPSLWFDNQVMLQNLKPFLSTYTDPKEKFVMVSLASETGLMATAVRTYAEHLSALAPTQIKNHFQFVDGEDHDSTNLKAVYAGLRELFQGYACPRPLSAGGFAAVEGHYKRLSQRYGFSIPVDENVVNGLGYGALSRQEYDKAIEIFSYNVTHYPNSPNVYDSLGEAFEKSGKVQAALAQYNKAVECAKSNKDPRLSLFVANRNRIRDQSSKM